MNNNSSTKRWVAIALAVIVFVLSLFTLRDDNVEEEEARSVFDSLPLAQNLVDEVVLEPGDMTQKILVVPIHGVIMDTTTTDPFTSGGYNHQAVLTALDAALEDESIAGVILDVDTPGGGVYESREISDRIRTLQEERDIPIYSSMGAMAASGGYYVSALADNIYATEETMTGSIGVIMSYANISGLLEEYGIDMEVIKSGEFKDSPSSFRESTEAEEEYLDNMLDTMFQGFIDVIDEGRDLPREDILELADGRVFLGEEAVENGLVDKLGYRDIAQEDMAQEMGVDNPAIVSIRRTGQDFFSLFGIESPGAKKSDSSDLQILSKLMTDYNQPKPQYLYGGGYDGE